MIAKKLYTAAQARELDAKAIASGITGYDLMCRAGEAAFRRLLQKWGLPEKLTIICGVGNNGGDGFVIARLAAQRQLAIDVFLVGDKAKITGEALLAYQDAIAAGIDIRSFESTRLLPEKGVIIDALLGTGLTGKVRGEAIEAIAWINQSCCKVMAVDIPSGLCGDSGNILGYAVSAELTVTFIGAKRGMFTSSGRDVCGEVIFDSLSLSGELYENQSETVKHDRLDELRCFLPARPANAHKGLYGHVMIIGGNLGMAGAVIMASGAAARCGAGLVSVATRPEHVSPVLANYPEVMAHGVVSGQELEPLLDRPTVLVVGPGLGKTPWSEQMLQKAFATNLPMVLDADALNLLSSHAYLKTVRKNNWVLTPHPGEAARLLGVSTIDIEKDRFASANALQARYGGVVLLKGAGTIIATEEGLSLCSAGNPGMATGGMGDVLSGIIAALLAQGLQAPVAARLGVCLHAGAADRIAQREGLMGMLASDLLAELRVMLNG